jgi:hypothetical protein
MSAVTENCDYHRDNPRAKSVRGFTLTLLSLRGHPTVTSTIVQISWWNRCQIFPITFIEFAV